MVPPERKARRRDEELLQAGIMELYERGYAAATVRGVADRLGINKGSLYHYLQNKQELLLRIVERVHEDADRIIATILIPDDISSLERVAYYVRCQVAYNLQFPELLSVYHKETAHLESDKFIDARATRREHDRLVAGLIREAQQAGEIHAPEGADQLADFVFMSLFGIHPWFQGESPAQVRPLLDGYTRFIVRGLAGATAHDSVGAIAHLPLPVLGAAERQV